MKTATKKMIEKALYPYIQLDGIFPYIKGIHVPTITSELLTSYSNIYCGICGENTECPVFIVKSSKKHIIYAKVIIEK